jgi:hypothetical protein
MPQNNNYKQDFLAIKYDYDTQCSMSEDVLSNYIRELDSKINPQAQDLGTLYGDYIAGRIFVIGKQRYNGPYFSTAYWAFDGPHTKIVIVADTDVPGLMKIGDTIDQLSIEERNSDASYIISEVQRGAATRVPKGAYIYRPPTAPPVSPADISGAFQPIGQYYSNLLDIKKRLNTFLEDASDEIGESQGYLVNQERYDNRGHPEQAVTSKEVAYGLFSEVRPSTIPILMALGTFMASISILMIFQMIGFTGQINIPPAVTAFQAMLSAPSEVPLYQNPMVLSGLVVVLGVGVILLGAMYLRSKNA